MGKSVIWQIFTQCLQAICDHEWVFKALEFHSSKSIELAVENFGMFLGQCRSHIRQTRPPWLKNIKSHNDGGTLEIQLLSFCFSGGFKGLKI
jgi:hypothetical protein